MGKWKDDEVVGADISPCGQYRYSLNVAWGLGWKTLYVIGLNPSKADMSRDDNTVRKCVNWAKKNGFDDLVMLNVFPFRATNPKDMKAHPLPFGEQTPGVLTATAQTTDESVIVAAWGGNAKHLDGGFEVAREFKRAGRPLMCWGVNKDGSPLHPCYAHLGELKEWQA